MWYYIIDINENEVVACGRNKADLDKEFKKHIRDVYENRPGEDDINYIKEYYRITRENVSEFKIKIKSEFSATVE